MNAPFLFPSLLTFLFIIGCLPAPERAEDSLAIRAVNEATLPVGKEVVVIQGATLIDGRGGSPVSEAVVVVEGNRIQSVGTTENIEIPPDARIIEASGLTLLPGLIDAHFHLINDPGFPALSLSHGVTSLRDPGAWIESYGDARASGLMNPRLFLTGPHLDMWPPAYPENSYILQDRKEAITMVNRFADQGASAIKVYFRLSLDLIEAVCETAAERGIPVTAHLEITDAREAISVGLDGIEHITSFGTALLPVREAEAYRQSILADNSARRQGRYEVWSGIAIDSPESDSLIRFVAEQETFVCPTLGAFEYRYSPEKTDSIRTGGFEQMLAFTGKASRGGVRMVVGSHGAIPYGGFGWAFQHEMELLAEAGMEPADILVAATLENARFFRIEDRLGSIEVGKQADLILIRGNPLDDISSMRNIERVMLNGVWVPEVSKQE